TACPPSAMRLRPTMQKEPEARVTRVETPVFNAILRVVTGKYGAEDFCFSESRVQDYMDLRLRGSAQLSAAGSVTRHRPWQGARSNHPKQCSYSHLIHSEHVAGHVPCSPCGALPSLPGQRFHLPGLADPGDCYGCSAALRDSERLFKLHPEADL